MPDCCTHWDSTGWRNREARRHCLTASQALHDPPEDVDIKSCCSHAAARRIVSKLYLEPLSPKLPHSASSYGNVTRVPDPPHISTARVSTGHWCRASLAMHNGLAPDGVGFRGSAHCSDPR